MGNISHNLCVDIPILEIHLTITPQCKGDIFGKSYVYY